MPLSVTKGELNRLGDRLIAGDVIDEADLDLLSLVLADYQQVLEQVKGLLRDLGFAEATDRVKTTGTLTDKLRRSHGMQLSRMQDLAGARIVVPDIGFQDVVTRSICEAFGGRGCPCKVVDRRKTPSFGYRAVHIIVRIDGMPVEIQVGTELQDAWAQIVERLGDQWGRGIRYGEDPEHPDARVRSLGLEASRRDAVNVLMQLSEAFATVEQARAETILNNEALNRLGSVMEGWKKIGPDGQPWLKGKIAPNLYTLRDQLLLELTSRDVPVDRALLDAGPEMTGPQLVQLAEISRDALSLLIKNRVASVQSSEQRLRDILQMIASATDEGG